MDGKKMANKLSQLEKELKALGSQLNYVYVSMGELQQAFKARAPKKTLGGRF